MDKNDFTTNDVIDNINIGDNTVDIVGYVTKVSNNFNASPTKCKFYKFVINNDQGREVQVIAWNEKTDMLKQIKEMGKIVYIGSAKASKIKDKRYNSGNVDFELQLKENSTVEIFDTYYETQNTVVEEVSVLEALTKINEKITVEGIVKTEFRKYKNRDFEFTVGSITDCFYKLEIKLNVDCSNVKFKKGDSVKVTGIVEQFLPGPPVLKVNNVDDIKFVDRDRVSFIEVLRGFNNKES